jgi:DNA-binding IclR family transcriptional regulator
MTGGTLVKGLQLITVLAAKPAEFSLTELAGAVEIDKSTVHRILAVMATMGFVEKNQVTKRYTIGPQFRALAAPSHGHIQQVALPRMRSLADSTGVTVALRIREGKQMVIVDRVENNDLLRVSFPIGLRHSVSFGSAGKAFLAFLPKAEAMQVLGSAFLRGNRGFLASLTRIRSRGYAISRGTAVKGTLSVSAPIVTEKERPIAVLSLSWPSAKYPYRQSRQIAMAAVKTARAISNAIKAPSSESSSPMESLVPRNGNFNLRRGRAWPIQSR